MLDAPTANPAAGPVRTEHGGLPEPPIPEVRSSTTAHQHPSREPTVLVIGPGSEHMGGMASVVQQILSLDLDGRNRMEFLPTTHANRSDEPRHSRILRHLRQIRALTRAIRRTFADVVHIHTCSGASFFRSVVDMIVAQQAGSRAILHVHGAAFDQFHREEPRCRQRWITWAFERADTVVGLSDGWSRVIRDMAPCARIVTIQNAVAIPDATSNTQVEGPCRFSLLARMDRWKGIDDLLIACQMLHRRDTPFLLTLAGPAGTAGDAQTIPLRIRQLGLEGVVQYVGPRIGEQKADLLSNTHVYVQSSHNEGMPIAMLEAMASGLPIVATRVGAVPEILKDGEHGRLVPAHSPDRLADAMHELATDGHLREQMGFASRRLAQRRFSLDRLTEDLAALYARVRCLPDPPGTPELPVHSPC